MKISEKLPQFIEDRTLLIVTGQQSAAFYMAYKGEINEIKKMRIENPKYSDKEGFFTRSGFGKRFGSGSVYEPKNLKTKKEFLREFEETMEDIARTDGVDKIYIFTPGYYASNIKERIPDSMNNLIEQTYMGNFLKLKPFKLLEIIKEKRTSKKERRDRSIVPSKAKKILDKFRKKF